MQLPDGVGGLDPRIHASPEAGQRNVKLAVETIGQKARDLIASHPPDQQTFRLKAIDPALKESHSFIWHPIVT
jgi:hypothetical protein